MPSTRRRMYRTQVAPTVVSATISGPSTAAAPGVVGPFSVSLVFGSIASLAWTVDGLPAGSTSTISPTLAAGTHTVGVSGTSSTGATFSASFSVAVSNPSPIVGVRTLVVPDGWPTQATTGVPAGTVLTPYTGPMTITTDNTVIDGKMINGSLGIRAANVTIRNSYLVGSVDTGDIGTAPYSLLIEDCELYQPSQSGDLMWAVNITGRRLNMHGGRRLVNMFVNVTIEDSILWGVATSRATQDHQSCARLGDGSVLRRCTLSADSDIVYDPSPIHDNAGPSAVVTGYGDFATVQNCTVDGNYFFVTSGGYAIYAGYGLGKPFPNSNNMRFINNVFELNPFAELGRKATGFFGTITAWPGSNTAGNVLDNNIFTDGTAVTA